MAEDSWYYVREHAAVGPFPFDQLRVMAADGRVRGDDWVARAGDSDWRPAAGIPRLFTAPPADTPFRRALGHWVRWVVAGVGVAFWGTLFGLCAWGSWVQPPGPPPVPVEVSYHPSAGDGMVVVVVVRNTGPDPLTGVRVVVASSDGDVAGRAESAIMDVPSQGVREMRAAELGGWVVRPGDSVWVCKDGFRSIDGVVPPTVPKPERR